MLTVTDLLLWQELLFSSALVQQEGCWKGGAAGRQPGFCPHRLQLQGLVLPLRMHICTYVLLWIRLKSCPYIANTSTYLRVRLYGCTSRVQVTCTWMDAVTAMYKILRLLCCCASCFCRQLTWRTGVAVVVVSGVHVSPRAPLLSQVP